MPAEVATRAARDDVPGPGPDPARAFLRGESRRDAKARKSGRSATSCPRLAAAEMTDARALVQG